MIKKLDSIENIKASLGYVLFWPIYLTCFTLIENDTDGKVFHLVHCSLDDLIPFNVWFIIPYVTWHALLVVVFLYALLFQSDSFRRLTRFFILTFGVTLVIYLIYPTYLDLRPDVVPETFILSDVVNYLYSIDTPQNVCPSLHVMGVFGMFFWSCDIRGKAGTFWKAVMVIATVLIVLSTLFIKQHSAVDVVAALPIAFIGWILCFKGKEMEKISEGI